MKNVTLDVFQWILNSFKEFIKSNSNLSADKKDEQIEILNTLNTDENTQTLSTEEWETLYEDGFLPRISPKVKETFTENINEWLQINQTPTKNKSSSETKGDNNKENELNTTEYTENLRNEVITSDIEFTEDGVNTKGIKIEALRAYLKATPKYQDNEDTIIGSFQKADTDQDGRISKEESFEVDDITGVSASPLRIFKEASTKWHFDNAHKTRAGLINQGTMITSDSVNQIIKNSVNFNNNLTEGSQANYVYISDKGESLIRVVDDNSNQENSTTQNQLKVILKR